VRTAVAFLGPFEEGEDEAEHCHHCEDDYARPPPRQLLDVQEGGNVGAYLRELDERAAEEDIEAHFVHYQRGPVVHRVGEKGKHTAGHGPAAQTRETAEVDGRDYFVLEVGDQLILSYALQVFLFEGLLAVEVELSDAVERGECLGEAAGEEELGRFLNVAVDEQELNECGRGHQQAPHHSPVLEEVEEEGRSQSSQREEHLHDYRVFLPPARPHLLREQQQA